MKRHTPLGDLGSFDLSKNPRLKSIITDFNQYSRFVYIARGLRKLYKEMPPADSMIVLDVGAGPGTLSNLIHGEFTCSVINVEMNRRYKIGNLVVADGRRLPFGNSVFDYVVSSDVLEHIREEYRSTFLKELFRCSRNGSVLTFSKLHTSNPHQGGIKIFEAMCKVFPDWYLEHNVNKLIDENVLKKEVEETGFYVVEIKPTGGTIGLFFTGLICLTGFRPVKILLNIFGYFAVTMLDFPPFYHFGLTAEKCKIDRCEPT